MPDSKAELRQLAIDAKWYGLDELVALVDTELAALQWGANVEEVGATDIEETKLQTLVLYFDRGPLTLRDRRVEIMSALV